MALAFDAAGGNFGSLLTSLTYNHTCSGGNRVLLVHVYCNGSGDNVTGVTYNSVAMTLVNKIQEGGSTAFDYLFILVNPATGTNQVAVSISPASNTYSSSSSYTGAKQTGQPDSNATGTAAGNLTLTDTVVNTGCWLVSGAGNVVSGPSAGTGTTSRNVTSASGIGDSNGTVGTGSQSMTWNGTGQTSGVIAAIIPAPPASGGNLTLMGVG